MAMWAEVAVTLAALGVLWAAVEHAVRLRDRRRTHAKPGYSEARGGAKPGYTLALVSRLPAGLGRPLLDPSLRKGRRRATVGGMESGDVLGPATSLSHLRPTEECVVIRDEAGALFVRAATDEDMLALLRDPLDPRGPHD